tara:strand:- start:2733 stop:2984 length:252 start_codon:yes stop_codon:yes gene_type:complete
MEWNRTFDGYDHCLEITGDPQAAAILVLASSIRAAAGVTASDAQPCFLEAIAMALAGEQFATPVGPQLSAVAEALDRLGKETP